MLASTLDSWTGVAVGIATLIVLAGGLARWWTRTDPHGRPKAWPRRLAHAIDQAIHVLIGREEVRDPERGTVIRPEQPPLTTRMVAVETGLQDMSNALTEQLRFSNGLRRAHERIDEVVETQADFDRRLKAVEGVRVKTPDTVIEVGPQTEGEQ